MKRTDPQSIRQIIDRVINESGNRKEVLEHRAAFAWGDVVGPEINRATTSRFIRNGVLHVTVNSASLKNELGFSKGIIKEQINSLMGSEIVKDIVIH